MKEILKNKLYVALLGGLAIGATGGIFGTGSTVQILVFGAVCGLGARLHFKN